MGWACTAANKRAMLCSASKRIAQTNTAATVFDEIRSVVIDVNAVFRNLLGRGSTCTMTPYVATLVMIKQHVLLYPNVQVVVFCFDSPTLVPEQRGIFHSTVRYQAATRDPKPGEVLSEDGRIYRYEDRPIEDEFVAHLREDHIPGGSWDRFWNSKKGKARMWEVIQECIETIVQQSWVPRSVYIIDKQDTSKLYLPSAFEPKDKTFGANWGEADTKSLHYALFLKEEYGPVVIATIDWDMALQVLAHDTSNIHVRIGTVFEDQETQRVFYSVQGVKKALKLGEITKEAVRCYELLDCSVLMSTFPTRTHRLEALFWCLAAGGVDYCNGLSSFGINEATCIKLVGGCSDPEYEPMFTEGCIEDESPFLRVVKVNLNQMVKRIISAKFGRIKNQNIKELNSELQSMLFCLLYFIGFDPKRDRAGPLLQTDFLLGNATNVADLYSGLYILEDKVFIEDHPDTQARCNPFVSYKYTIAEKIPYI